MIFSAVLHVPIFRFQHFITLMEKMKTVLLLSLILLLAGCSDSPATMQALKNIARDNDPAKLSLEEGFNKYVRRTQLNDHTETGIITLKDGSSSKYWFQSHHLTKDAGGTWFVMSDGQEMFMAGWFCCEVQLPEEQLESLPTLRQFIRKHHDIAP